MQMLETFGAGVRSLEHFDPVHMHHTRCVEVLLDLFNTSFLKEAITRALSTLGNFHLHGNLRTLSLNGSFYFVMFIN